ncbi:sugar-binding protein [Paenibacillus shunpengii]|uniref:Sugar-binding protein n=1 Tax=Paenibacillus shunpengii TaxID=2054424 RepID=A0ABW5SMT2_9BACL
MLIKKTSGLMAVILLVVTLLSSFSVIVPQHVEAAEQNNAVDHMSYAGRVTEDVYLETDGILDEAVWSLDTPVTNVTVGTAADNDIRFNTVWSSTYLYVGVQVLDTTVVNNHNDTQLYEDDSVEIFLDGNNGKTNAYQSDDYQIMIRSDNRLAVKQKSADVVLDGLHTATSPIEGGYNVELRIPWASLGVTPEERLKIGFDISNNDNDTTDGVGGRAAQLTWNAKGNTNYGNTSTFGTLSLAGNTKPVISTEGSPTIDGTLSENTWHLDYSLSFSNNEVEFGSLSDPHFLYLGFKVGDAEVHRDSDTDPRNDDSIEIFLDGNNAKTNSYEEENDRHFVIGYGDLVPVEIRGRAIDNVKSRSVAMDGGWAVEVAIPWSTLGIVPSDGIMLGFDVAVNDDDNGGSRDEQAIWSGDEYNEADTSGFGLLIVNNENIVKPSYEGPKATFVDEASDLSKIFEKSSNIVTASWPSALPKEPRILNNGGTEDYVIYKSPSSLDILDFVIEEWVNTDPAPFMKFYVSNDNQSYRPLDPGVHLQSEAYETASRDNGWYTKYKHTSSNLPEGAVYLKIEFTNNGASNGHKSLLENVSFNYKTLELREEYEGPRVTFEDPATSQALIYKKSTSGNLTTSSIAQGGPLIADRIKIYNGWEDNTWIMYKNPENGSDIVDFEIETVEKNGNWIRLSVSPDENNWTVLSEGAHYQIETLINPDAEETANYGKYLYKSENMPEGHKYIKLEFMNPSGAARDSSVTKVRIDYKKDNLPPSSLTAINEFTFLNESISGDVYGQDGDGDPLTFSILQAPKHGTAVIPDSTEDRWTYTPKEGFVGYDIFLVEVSDSRGATSMTKVVVNITDRPSNLTYYVDISNGNNQNTGLSEDQAFQTIQRAADMTKPGDTVLIMDGTYVEDFSRGDNEGVVVIRRSGAPNYPITYKNYPGHKPKLHVKKGWNHILINSASYITIEGLEISGNGKNITYEQAKEVTDLFYSGDFSWMDERILRTQTNGISVRPHSVSANFVDKAIPSHIIIRNNYVHDVPGGGINTDQADYVTIEHNTVHDTAQSSSFGQSGISIFHAQDSAKYDANDYQYIIRNNVSYNNYVRVEAFRFKTITDGNGIIIDDFSNGQIKALYPNSVAIPYAGRTLVENNLVYHNGGSGIHSYHSHNIDIFNNTAYDNARTPELIHWGNMFIQDGKDSRMMNNIIVTTNPKGNATSNIKNTNVKYDYNIYFGGVAAGVPAAIKGPNDVIADPRFVDPAGLDFRLLPDSPAINTGNSNIGTDFDLDGVPRPWGASLDRGAYEYYEDLEAPTPPKNLTASEITQSSFVLNWTKSIDDVGVKGYHVYQGDKQIGTVTGTTYDIMGLNSRTKYSIKVKAYDISGKQSMPSETLDVTTSPAANEGGSSSETPKESTNSPEKSTDKVINTAQLEEGAVYNTEVEMDALLKAIENADQNVTIVVPDNTDANSVKVKLNSEVLTKAIENGIERITIKNDFVTVSYTLQTLEAVKDNVVFIITNLDQSGLDSSKVTKLEFSVLMDGKAILNLGSKESIQITIPFTLADMEKKHMVVAYHISEDGKKSYKKGKYDLNSKELSFYTNQLGKYEVMSNETKFSDLHHVQWAEEAIEYLAALQIVKGYSEQAFKPHGEITRAEFLQMLINAYDLKDTSESTANFKDVKEDAWYIAVIASAHKLGIVSGYKDNTFKPNRTITREEMIVMAANTVKASGTKLNSIKEKVVFSDHSEISNYAADAVYDLQQAGILNGLNNGKFSPNRTATRAESAVIIQRLL